MNPNAGPPYNLIWRTWQDGMVLPILGPGVPLAFHDWQSASPRPPLGREVADALAQELSLPREEADDLDLAVVASYYKLLAGRRQLNTRLRKAFDRPAEPNLLHRLIASSKLPQLIIVTTADTTLEQAFDSIGAKYDLVVQTDARESSGSVYWWPHAAAEPIVTRSNQLEIDLDSTTVIYKLFGTIDRKNQKWDAFISAEDDILELVASLLRGSAVPAAFRPYIAEKSALYLGFSLGSWLNRTLLRTFSALAGPAEQRASWAIVLRAGQMEHTFWSTQNVHVYDLDLRTFSENLLRTAEFPRDSEGLKP